MNKTSSLPVTGLSLNRIKLACRSPKPNRRATSRSRSAPAPGLIGKNEGDNPSRNKTPLRNEIDIKILFWRWIFDCVSEIHPNLR
jgi:hypothetical protein